MWDEAIDDVATVDVSARAPGILYVWPSGLKLSLFPFHVYFSK